MLSKRLLAIANLIDKNEVIQDVGTDHALLPCFLVSKGICPKAYATDNKIGPLQKADENIKKYHLEDKVITLIKDGLDTNHNDISTIVIAGMGFNTVKHIFETGDVSMYRKIIVQVNKDCSKLREYISSMGYTIEDEKIVYEDFYYEIVVFSADMHEPYSSKEIEYGPINLSKGDKTFIEYLKYQKDKLSSYKTKKYDNKIDELNKLIDSYKKGLDIWQESLEIIR